MQDITPIIGENIKVIESYGGGGFTVSGQKIEGGIFIHSIVCETIKATRLEGIDTDELINRNLKDKNIEILLVGYGNESDFFSSKDEVKFKKAGLKLEYMNSGAAARTYNVLISEERNVAAILLAV